VHTYATGCLVSRAPPLYPQEKAQSQSFANALATIGKFVIKKKTGERDQIYGSVQVSEIADAIYQQTGRNLAEAEFNVSQRSFATLGMHALQLAMARAAIGSGKTAAKQ
jgi:ribosomal protein L9